MGKGLLIIWLGAMGSDIASTNLAMSRGAVEVILPVKSQAGTTLIMSGQAALGIWAYKKLNPHHPKLAKTLYWVGVGFHGSAAISNINLFTHLK